MKSFLIPGVALTALAIALTGCNNDKKAAPKLDSQDAKAAYTIGYMTGKSMVDQVPGLDLNSYEAGLHDAYAKKEGAITKDEMKAVMMAFSTKVKAEAEAKMKQEGDENAKKGEAYMAENAKKPGVKTTPSGLQYEVITEGKGPKPKATDVVKVNYEGKLVDGTVFDSSYKRNEPAQFPLNQVVPGWTEALQLMPVGSKYRLVIPAKLGYGEMPSGPIPANSTLVFEVELLEIVKQ